jgi:hypothetical protein
MCTGATCCDCTLASFLAIAARMKQAASAPVRTSVPDHVDDLPAPLPRSKSRGYLPGSRVSQPVHCLRRQNHTAAVCVTSHYCSPEGLFSISQP